jgi:hypothetical protein
LSVIDLICKQPVHPRLTSLPALSDRTRPYTMTYIASETLSHRCILEHSDTLQAKEFIDRPQSDHGTQE